MAHIPMDDIQELWNDTQEKNWGGLYQTLQQHSGKAQGISQNLIMMMLPEVKNLEQSGEPFPDSPDKLSQVLNQHLSQYAEQEEGLDNEAV